MAIQQKIGIYLIKNLYNGNCYVGSTTNFRHRWCKHRSLLRKGLHHSIALQRSWNNRGGNNFEFVIIQVCTSSSDIYLKEQWWIDYLSPAYNMCPSAKSSAGIKRSEEFKNKLRGRIISEEVRNQISLAKKGSIPWNKGKKIGPQSKQDRLNKSIARKEYLRKKKEIVHGN